jgi:hypothetical protein
VQNLFSIILVALLIYSLPLDAAEKKGARVRVQTIDAEQIEGELLVVRPDKIVICKIYGTEKESLVANPDEILTLPVNDIRYIIVRGRRNTAKGFFVGFLTGSGLGALFGFASGDDPPGFLSFSAGQKAVMFGVVLGVIGGVGGTILGYVQSTSDRRVEPVEGIGFQHIHTYARYGDYEPDFVRRSENN